jgi:hypothetical protein
MPVRNDARGRGRGGGFYFLRIAVGVWGLGDVQFPVGIDLVDEKAATPFRTMDVDGCSVCSDPAPCVNVHLAF